VARRVRVRGHKGARLLRSGSAGQALEDGCVAQQGEAGVPSELGSWAGRRQRAAESEGALREWNARLEYS